MRAGVERVVALDASNLTRGFRTVVSAARATWGPAVQVLAALGHDRSYGAPSRVALCTLPGIRGSGLWLALESLPRLPTRAVRLFRLDPAWYGLDPIHIRPSVFRSAWPQIMGTRPLATASGEFMEWLRLALMPPERRRIIGVERVKPQPGVLLPSGGRVWLY